MNKFALAAVATLFAAPVFAQAAGSVGVGNTPGSTAPSYTQGSGQRAGGPANELNSSTGGVPSLQGTVADPNRAPSYTQGSGQSAGGPANELNPSTGMPATTGSVGTSTVPSYQSGSGQSAGGPANELNRR